MLNAAQKQKIEKDLAACSNMMQVFDYLEKNYSLEDTKLNAITRPMITKGLIAAIEMTNAKQR